MTAAILLFMGLHLAASVWKYVHVKPDPVLEPIRQHHERCVMLGLIALAIWLHP